MGKREQDARRNGRDRARLVADPTAFRHGVLRTFALGCRCTPCRDEAARMMTAQLGDANRAPNRRKPWTGADLTLITDRRTDGRYVRSTRALATLLGRSYDSVKTMRRKCGERP